MGKKNKYKKTEGATDGASTSAEGAAGQPQGQPRQQQQSQGQQQRPQQQSQGQQQRPQQQSQGQQQRPQQQSQGQQQRPQQQSQGQQQRPQQQSQGQQQSQEQQRRPQQPQGQQQSSQQPQEQQQRPQQPKGQQQRPQQPQRQQQRPQQPQGQQQSPQQPQGQQQRPQQPWGQQQSHGQQQQQQRTQGQQQQKPRQQPQAQQQHQPPHQKQQQPESQKQQVPQSQVQQPLGQKQPQQQGREQPPVQPQQQRGQSTVQPQIQQQQAQYTTARSGASTSTPSPQHSTASQSSISKSSSTSSFSATVSQRSIPPGTVGIKGECEANYLILNLGKMPDVAYHYDVTITPDRPKKFFRDAFKQFINTYLSGVTVAYDGVKSCYIVQKLPHAHYEGEVTIADTGNRQKQFVVVIKTTIDPVVELKSLKSYHNERVFDKPMRAMQCIEVVLANACHDKGIRVGRSFFTPPQNKQDLDEGYELYTGLYQAAILGDVPYLNVDISHKSFPSPINLVDYINDIMRRDPRSTLERRDHQTLHGHLKGLNIKYTPPPCFGAAPRTYRVNDVSTQPASVLSFTNEKGEKLTVQRYFASRGYNLRFPNLNCIVSGSEVKPNYLPIELCSIEPGQALKRKDGTKQVQKMIRFAATSTDERKRKIMDKLRYFMHNADRLVQGFGISIGNGFITVPTRLLKPPSIEYRASRYVEPRNGSWRNLQYLTTGVTLQKTGHKWAVLYTSSRSLRHATVQQLSNMLFSGAERMGINLDSRQEVTETRDIVKSLEEYKRNGYDLVVVVIPFFGTSYANIKQKAELTCGLLTQCIKEQTLGRGVNDQLISNLLLKVNSKLNGSNHKIANNTNLVLDKVMFMGADVTHPSPDQRSIPSVVGVAASHDLNGASYNMQYRLQESTKEEIVDMKEITQHHLRVYFRKQNCYPKSIIYYRDGVSDGQFQKVEHLELGGIRAACKELRFTPKITCVIVVKRHHTRFFPTKPTGDKFNNVLPGTVVDQKIVHPNETQFFMVSHQSIQGTAKPTRYNVIVDDAKMAMDDLQKMTNNLCYMFPRCNRAVSYPAPAYLAHLVAARGRVYIEGQRLIGKPREDYRKRLINEQFMNTTPMFFV